MRRKFAQLFRDVLESHETPPIACGVRVPFIGLRGAGWRSTTAGLLFSCALADSTARAQTLRTPAPAQIDAVFAMYDSVTTPGCGVAVIRGDSLLYRKAYGMAHIGFRVPMTTSTTMWIPYSEARVFVALAVGLLAQDGRIALDSPVVRYVPELPAYAANVTVRHLLHHTSGLADYGVLDPSFDSMNGRLTEASMFRALARWGKLGNTPGSAQVYSNTDYALLRLLVERVTEGTLHQFLTKRVFVPLGMRDTRVGADQADVVPNHALFHEPGAEGWRTVLRYRSSPTGGISVNTSVEDLVRWAQASADPRRGYGAVLAALEPGRPARPTLSGLAYGVYADTINGRPAVVYKGVGDYKYLVRVPDAALSVVTLCNSYEQMWTFGPAVAELFLPPASGDRASHASARATGTAAPTVSLPSDALQRLTGEYVRMDGRPGPIRVTRSDSGLRIGPNEQSARSLRAIGPNRFEAVAPGVGVFHLTFLAADTVPGGVLLLTRDAVTGAEEPALRRNVPLPPLSAEDLREYAGTYIGVDVEATLYFSVVEGRLLAEARALARNAAVQVAGRDRFRFDIYDARFERDASGRVTHVVLDAARVKGMRYTKALPPAGPPSRR